MLGLTKAYGDFKAVDDLDMEVRKGEFLGLLGPNGAGKTTVLKSISGMAMPTSGTIQINGIDIRDHKRALEGVGCMVGTPELYPAFTPSEMLEYVGRMQGIPDDEIRVRARDLLETMRMWSWRDKRIGGFSKGMKQRVSLAAVLIHNPRILLLDEPSSGLDPRGMVEMHQILKELNKGGMTLVMSTHLLKEASELCTAMTMINHGKKIASGSVSDLLQKAGATVRLDVKVAGDIPHGLIGKLEAVRSVKDPVLTDERTVTLYFDGSDEQQSEILEAIQSYGLRLLSVNESDGGLESVYMSLTDEGAEP